MDVIRCSVKVIPGVHSVFGTQHDFEYSQYWTYFGKSIWWKVRFLQCTLRLSLYSQPDLTFQTTLFVRSIFNNFLLIDHLAHGVKFTSVGLLESLCR